MKRATKLINELNQTNKKGEFNAPVSRQSPKFSERILWINGQVTVKLSDDLSIHLPKCLVGDFTNKSFIKDIETLCKRVIEWGYNTLLLGAVRADEVLKVSKTSLIEGFLQQLFTVFHKFGLKGILIPQINDFSISELLFDNKLQEFLSPILNSKETIDGIFWRGQALNKKDLMSVKFSNFTSYELFLKEIQLLEKVLSNQCSLYYYLPEALIKMRSGPQSILEACEEVAFTTNLLFPMGNGGLLDDFSSNHLVWNELKKDMSLINSPLLPVVNSGAIHFGEGLWPTFSFDLLYKSYQYLSSDQLKGAICMTNSIPISGSLLDCHLWTSGKILCTCDFPEYLFEMWWSKFSNSSSHLICYFLDLLKKFRKIALEVIQFYDICKRNDYSCSWRNEPKLFVESQVYQLKLLQYEISLISDEMAKKNIVEPFSYFLKDMNFFMLQGLQLCNVSIGNLLPTEFNDCSFWGGKSGNKREGVDVESESFFLTPYCNHEDKVMNRIFKDNRLLV